MSDLTSFGAALLNGLDAVEHQSAIATNVLQCFDTSPHEIFRDFFMRDRDRICSKMSVFRATMSELLNAVATIAR